jgi:hypothetical protein
MTFTIKPDTRVLFEMAWYFKYNSPAPTDWAEYKMLRWVREYDAECKTKIDKEDAVNAALARAHEPSRELPIPEGLPSLGGLLLRSRPPVERLERAPQAEQDYKPNAAERLAGRKR